MKFLKNKFTLWFLAIFLNTISQAYGKDEVIVIFGDPVCGSPGTTIVGENNNKECVCEFGWREIGKFSDGEPMCTTKAPPKPILPDIPDPEPTPEPNPNPKPPTALQCLIAGIKCISNATKAVDDCKVAYMAFHGALLAKDDPIPCFHEPVSNLLTGLTSQVSEFGFAFKFPCTKDSLSNSDLSAFGLTCKQKFRQRGIERCIAGINSNTSGASGTTGLSVDLPFGVSVSGSGTKSFSETSRFGIGINGRCKAVGIKAVSKCQELGNQCNNLASGSSPLLVNAPESTAERLLSTIDKTLLGFSAGNAFGRRVLIGSQQPFRSLNRASLEHDKLYVLRLKFLSKWSGFLKRESITTDQKQLMHLAFLKAQKKFVSNEDQYSKIIQLIWTVNPKNGEAGSKHFWNILKEHRKSRKIDKISRLAEKALRSDIEDILGVSLSKKFFNEVWLGMVKFGYSHPMRNKTIVGANNRTIRTSRIGTDNRTGQFAR